MDSILVYVKKLLGIDADYTHFDIDIILHINSVIMALTQLGVGSETGFSITGDTETWEDLIGTRKDIEAVKSYIVIKVRLLFDPPQSNFVLEAYERMIHELEWRIMTQVDNTLPETIPTEGGAI